MNCPNCGRPVRAGAKFCEECGIVLPASTATEAAQPVSAFQPDQGSVAPMRRGPTLRAPAPRGDEAFHDPSGTTMLPPPNLGQARRTFALVAIGLVALLSCCCLGAAGVIIYLFTQTPAQMPLPGLM